jgi:hypothetical protein
MGGRIKGLGEGVNSCMIYFIHCENLCKCHNVHPPITTTKEKLYIKKQNRKN